MNELAASDWLDQLVEKVTAKYPDGEIVVSSGHSPSGTYHVGTLREVVTANAITWALKQVGRSARHIDFVDDFDAFRKVPAGVPEEWSRYIGVPLAVVPDPQGCHKSYGLHYLGQLHSGLEAIGAIPDETISGYDNYQSGAMAHELSVSLDKISTVRQILTEVGGRKLDENWSPVQILGDDQNLRTLKFAGYNNESGLVKWVDKAGKTGEVSLDSGRVKLDWRLDWPARWAKWQVRVEPFGRDHATKGGSYDTGAVLVEKVFGGSAPFPVPYEFINTVGETLKMSKSSGNVLTPNDALEVMPPEILKYFVIKARPSRTLFFDPGLGLYSLIDEYSKAASGDGQAAAMAYASAEAKEQTIARVPFNHLVAVYQTARGDKQDVREILARTGYEQEANEQWPVIERELVFVKNWLDKHAPDSVKFKVQDKLPELDLSEPDRRFLAKLADTVSAEADLNGQGMHDAIYAASEVAGIKPGQAFQVLYQVILGQNSGPKAGWFLASLDRKWLINRLRLTS